MATLIKQQRIEFRIDKDDKSSIEEAAKYRNMSVSSYILNVVLKQVKIDLEEKEIISLSNSERDLLMKPLSNPPKANNNLKELF